MIVRDDFSCHPWMYFVSHKYDAASAFEKFLADLSVKGTPSEVVIVRSDDGGEFMQGKFGKLGREIKIKQELTTADSPEYNGVVERGLAMIESAALAARVQASELFPGCSIPEGPSLRAETMNWACDAYNQIATVANSGNRSPHEMFYGETPRSSPIPFLKPGFCKFKRTNKIDPKARECFYLGPARNHLNESKRVLVRTEKVIITINITWAHAPLSRPPTARSTPSVEGEGCDRGMNREVSSFDGHTESGDDESESRGEGVEMVTSEADDTERENTRSFRGGIYQLLRAPEAAYTAGFLLARRAEGLSVRALLMLWLPLTAFRMVPISSLLHCAPEKQRDLPCTSPDRYARIF
ncbi:unnamed protein product [Ascophyllum nodosum]